jgi:4-amino-4-deoxy-L-arabinose transferase-like glycosyltransferase
VKGDPRRSEDWRNLTICAVAVAASVLASRAVVEAGFNDDWSYAHTVLNFARTGHLAYDNWGTPTLFVQAVWGGALIRLFGFSFELLRLSTLPFAIGCGWLCYSLSRMAGLQAGGSLFAALVFVTSPLFVPLGASFMTDIYGCFFILLSVYCGACAAEEPRRVQHRIYWLTAVALVGLLGGLERQSVYLAPGSVLLWAIWRWRTQRTVWLSAVGLLAAIMVAGYLAVTWQFRQPFGVGAMTELTIWRRALIFPANMILTLALLTAPAAVRLRRFDGPISLRLYAVSCFVVLTGFVLYWRISEQLLFPWESNIITTTGILGPEDIGGQKPAVFNHDARIAITLLALACLVQITAVLLKIGRSANRLSPFTELPAVLQIAAMFTVIYTGTLTYQARRFTTDRYLLPLIPFVLIALLFLSRRVQTKAPAEIASWCLLTMFAFYGIASTHDYFASLRARVTAVRQLERGGAKRLQIAGGFELDAWTELEIAGHLTHPYPPMPLKWEEIRSGTWFRSYTPHIDAHYQLSWSDQPGFRNATPPLVSFGAWLPPFRREVKLLMRDRVYP